MDSPVEGAHSIAPEGRRVRTVPILVALLVFAVAAAGAFATLWLTKDDDFTSADVASYLDARAPAVVDRTTEVMDLLLNYDATNIEDVGDRLLEMSTGNFADDYEDLVGGGNLQKALRDASASSRGQIVDGPDVYFRDPSEAVAIMTVTQTAQSRSNPTGITTEYVFRVILLRTGSEWKADDVKILSTNAG
ncbi:MAG TPA: hypothetical protein VHJ34_03315 [Actinomycetota bacterium]|nr:hypothetical protein [Actinomycetota bacterium]